MVYTVRMCIKNVIEISGWPISVVVSFVLGYCLVQTDYIVSFRENKKARKLKAQ